MDRRAAFCLGAAIVVAMLIPVSEDKYRWLPIALSITYALLAMASWADARTRRRSDT